jgi:hypothetical protein
MLNARRRRKPGSTYAQVRAEGANIRRSDLRCARQLAERLLSVGVLRLEIEHEHDCSEKRKKKREERERSPSNGTLSPSMTLPDRRSCGEGSWIDHGARLKGSARAAASALPRRSSGPVSRAQELGRGGPVTQRARRLALHRDCRPRARRDDLRLTRVRRGRPLHHRGRNGAGASAGPRCAQGKHVQLERRAADDQDRDRTRSRIVRNARADRPRRRPARCRHLLVGSCPARVRAPGRLPPVRRRRPQSPSGDPRRASWWAADELPHVQLTCERFASTLAWAYWPSPANVMQPPAGGDEAGSVTPAAFRASVNGIIRAHQIYSVSPR